MGFLDKLLGRTKDTAGDVAEKVEPMVDKAQDSASQAWDKAKDKLDDATDKGEDTAGDAAAQAKDTVSDAASTSDSGPSAA